MFRRNAKTILLALIVILLIIVGVYAFTSQNNDTNNVDENNLPGDENGVDSEVNNEENIQDMENIDVSPEEQGAVNTYLENNISVLSPEEAVLGGTFYVTTVKFPADNIAIVDYEDGHIALTAQADYSYNNGQVTINSFELIGNNDMERNVEENEENSENKGDVSVENRGRVNTYIENNISSLSPQEAVLGGSFYITSVSFPEEGIAIVNYEDGHRALTAKANFEVNSNNEVKINSFELIPDGSTVERSGNNDVDICVDMCGDGTCQEVVCMGEGCPCAETAQSCPADCS
jgi:cbb3-type cytochrome oxidase subunit 3